MKKRKLEELLVQVLRHNYVFYNSRFRWQGLPPMSVIFKDLNFAEKVLGFSPKYVNYDFSSKTGGYIPQFYITIP